MTREDSGVSRRRVLQGAVWTAPVVLIATSAPAVAASEVNGGLKFNDFTAISALSYWNNTAQESIPAVIGQANVQNLPSVGGGTSPDVMEFTITYALPVGAITSPAWGLGSNDEDIADPTQWEHVSGPLVTEGVATIAFRYIGTPLSTYGNVQPTCWVQAVGSQAGLPATCSVVAIHTGGTTSSDARGATTSA
jgi:hypothetical protein